MPQDYESLYGLQPTDPLQDFTVERIPNPLQSTTECELPPDIPFDFLLPAIPILPPKECDINVDIPLVPLPEVCSPSYNLGITITGEGSATVTGGENIEFTRVAGTDCTYSASANVSISVPAACTDTPYELGSTINGTGPGSPQTGGHWGGSADKRDKLGLGYSEHDPWEDEWDKILASGKDLWTETDVETCGWTGDLKRITSQYVTSSPNYTEINIFTRTTKTDDLGGVTYIGPEVKTTVTIEEEETVTVDVLVGLQLITGQLQGQYKTITVLASTAADPEWRNLLAITASLPAACP